MPFDLKGRNAVNLINQICLLDSEIHFQIKSGRRINGKSLMGLLSLGIKSNDIIKITVDGLNEKTDMEQLIIAFENIYYMERGI